MTKPKDLLFDVGDDSLKPSKYPSPPIKSLRIATIDDDFHEAVINTKYKEEYIDTLINMAKSGFSARAFCSQVGISYATFMHWKAEIPAFREATKQAEMHRHYFYEQTALENLGTKEFNCALFDRLTKSVVKWKDEQEVVHTHTHQVKPPELMSPRERQERIKQLLEASSVN